MKTMISLKEAARLLNISLRTTYRLFHDGVLRGAAYKPYRAYLESVEELQNTPHLVANYAPRKRRRLHD